MHSPLNKRILRDLLKDYKKYIALLLLMSFMIAVASGVFVGNDSILQAIDESYDKYNMEDGHFELKEKADKDLFNKLNSEIKICDQFYKDTIEKTKSEDIRESNIRIFKVREIINLACLMEGKLPNGKNEIAIDRSHASNVGIKVGDYLEINNKDFEVVGLIASSDYSCLFENNGDFMYNALTFDIAFMDDEAWDLINETIKYQYAYKYYNHPENEIKEKELSDDLIEKIAILAQTGGYTLDKDEAEELANNIDEWTIYLEEMEEYAESLEQRADTLKERENTLTIRANNLKNQIPTSLEEMQQLQNASIALQNEASQLKKDADALKKEADVFKEKEDEINEIVDKLKALEPYEDKQNELVDYVPNYLNQAIHFARNDLGKDKAVMNILVYIFIAVVAFMFAITTSNKIREEAAVIGTLRATGYTKKELLKYYMLIPILITLLASIIGNILGYTLFKDIAVSLYYNSYSLLKFETLMSAKALIITTLIPLLLMFVVNFIVIKRLLKLAPLKFLRRDLSISKRKKAIKLPSFSFMNRFRLRIFMQNAFDYLTLFLGLLFIMILLGFTFGLPETIDHYKGLIVENRISDYQTILKDYKDNDDNIIKTNTENAEIFSMKTLYTVDGIRIDEDISIYGFIENSKYIKINDSLKDNEVYISTAFKDKFLYEIGDEITLKEQYENKEYKFIVKGIYNYPSTLAIFMSNDNYNKTFNNDIEAFNGYLSNKEIKDIAEDKIYTTITIDDITSLANQMNHSLGGFASYLAIICLIMAIIVLYLLTKTIIEKNAISISMVKVLGYENKEINSLYILLTSIIVIIFSLITAILSIYLLGYLFRLVMNGMAGWLYLHISLIGIVKMIIIVLIAYFVVSFIDMKQIQKIPLSEALKNVE